MSGEWVQSLQPPSSRDGNVGHDATLAATLGGAGCQVVSHARGSLTRHTSHSWKRPPGLRTRSASAHTARVAAGPARVLLELRRLAALLVALEEGAAAAAAAASLGRSVVLLLLLGGGVVTAARAVVAIVSASLCAVVRSTALAPLGRGGRVCAS